MITKDKIRLFESYSGDINGFASAVGDSEGELSGRDDWFVIIGFCQDIELINKKLAAPVFLTETLAKLSECCDRESFDWFTNRIECYKGFQKIAEILRKIKSFISKEADTIWAGYDDADEFLDDLNKDIQGIENCDYETLKRVYVGFLPTCTYQELSLSNGWSREYHKLAGEFDDLYDQQIGVKTIDKSPQPKEQRSWLQRLLFFR